MKLLLNQITCNPDLQIREHVFDYATVEDYAEGMKAGAVFPPITVFYDGSAYWLADGFHRYAAARQAKAEDIEADVRPGSKRDAILYAVGANSDNGLRRTNADKRNAVMKLLNDREWAKWNDSEIARACKVSHTFVAKLRPPHLETFQDRSREVARNGSTYTMNTANIGHREPPRDNVVMRTTTEWVARQPPPTREEEPEEQYDEEGFLIQPECINCRFYFSDIKSDDFFCMAQKRVYLYDGEMPCNGESYKEAQDGVCPCCGQDLVE